MINRIKPASNPWLVRLTWLLLLLALLSGGAGYFYLHPEELPDWAANTGLGRDLQTTVVYKWQDAAGKWHVSDQKPTGNIEYQTGHYTRDTNVLPPPPELRQ